MAAIIATLIQQAKKVILRQFFIHLLMLINLPLRRFPILTPTRFPLGFALYNDLSFLLAEDKLWPLFKFLII